MTTIYQTPYLDFKMAKSPSDTDWYYVKRTNDKARSDSAVVLTTLVKKENGYNFLFLKTKRPAIYAENKANYCLESPAGLIADENKDETLIECANKELLEETGYRADELFIELKNSSTSAGLSSETLSYVTAIVNNNEIIQKPVNDGGIIADRFFVEADKLYSFLKNVNCAEMSVSSPTICGIYFALLRINA